MRIKRVDAAIPAREFTIPFQTLIDEVWFKEDGFTSFSDSAPRTGGGGGGRRREGGGGGGGVAGGGEEGAKGGGRGGGGVRCRLPAKLGPLPSLLVSLSCFYISDIDFFRYICVGKLQTKEN